MWMPKTEDVSRKSEAATNMRSALSLTGDLAVYVYNLSTETEYRVWEEVTMEPIK